MPNRCSHGRHLRQLTGILLEEDEGLYLDWLPYLADSQKVDSAPFGLLPGTLMRPALSVVPMGGHSAVALVQAGVRTLVFEKAKIPLKAVFNREALTPPRGEDLHHRLLGQL